MNLSFNCRYYDSRAKVNNFVLISKKDVMLVLQVSKNRSLWAERLNH